MTDQTPTNDTTNDTTDVTDLPAPTSAVKRSLKDRVLANKKVLAGVGAGALAFLAGFGVSSAFNDHDDGMHDRGSIENQGPHDLMRSQNGYQQRGGHFGPMPGQFPQRDGQSSSPSWSNGS